ncbi:metallophosphoesterase [Candidatus Dependentiae bacterium]|nr:metallophosphoesterase [Candidatus Dependentiae bacterium]
MSISRKSILFMVSLLLQGPLLSDSKRHVVAGGLISAACGVGAWVCFNKSGDLLRQSVRSELDEETRQRVEQQSENYRRIGYLLTAGSAASGAYALGSSLLALGVIGGAGLLLGASSEGAAGLDKPGFLDVAVEKEPEIRDVFLDPYINEIINSCREYNELFDVTLGYPDDIPVVIPGDEFKKTLKAFIESSEKILTRAKICTDRLIKPFARRVILKEGDEAFVMGDIHGSVHSLIRNLLRLIAMGHMDEDLKLKDNMYGFFTGDYGDRGHYGVEVWYILMKLFLKNPDKIFLIKGNHETRSMANVYGLRVEVEKKYGKDSLDGPFDLLSRAFLLLSSVVYVGDKKDVIQVCHGGIPVCDTCLFSEQKVYRLLSKVYSPTEKASEWVVTIDTEAAGQFWWNDFDLPFGLGVTNRGSRFVGIGSVVEIFEGTIVRNVFRGHWHNIFSVSRLSSQMNSWVGFPSGVSFPVKNHMVYTFMSCPGSCLHLFRDGFGILKITDTYDTWTLTPYQYNLPKERDEMLMRVIRPNGRFHVNWVDE